MKTNWTDEDDDWLRQLAAKGWSAGQMAVELNRSRNAIIGRLHRKKIALANKPKTASGPAKPRKRRGRDPARSPQLHAIVREKLTTDVPKPVATPAGRGVRFMDIGPQQCRWPVVDGHAMDTFRFCGAPAAHEDCPWCEHHLQDAYRGAA